MFRCVQTLCCALFALFKTYVRSTDASDPRLDNTFDIHYSRRLTMCGHVRWKGAVNYQHVVPKGQGVSFLGLQGGHRARCNWRRKDVLVSGGGRLRSLYQCGRLHRESCCFSQTRFERSWGSSCQPSSYAIRIAIFSRSSTHACCEGDFPLSFQRNVRFALEQFLG